MHDSGHCISCGRASDLPGQHFCPACGQPTPVHRIDWHFLGHELEHSVLHMDRGLLYTLRSLMLRPGRFIRDYIEGRRANHVKPVLLIMLMAGLVVLLSRYVVGGDVLGGEIRVIGAGGGKTDVAAANALFGVIKDWTNQHYAIVTLLLLPMEALSLKLAFRRFRELNYPEWLVIAAFLTAQGFLIQSVFIAFDHWLPGRQQWALAVTLVYNIISLAQFFAGYPRWKSVLRAIFGFFLFEIAGSVLLAGAMIAILASRAVHGT